MMRCLAAPHAPVACACCLRLLPAPVACAASSLDGSSSRLGGRSWVSQFWMLAVEEPWRGKVDVNLLPSSAGHSPGLTVEGLNLLPASAMLAPLGALWMALSWFPRVLFPLLLRPDAVVMRQSPPLGTMWKLAESSKLAVCGWWERCSSCRPAPSSRFGESK